MNSNFVCFGIEIEKVRETQNPNRETQTSPLGKTQLTSPTLSPGPLSSWPNPALFFFPSAASSLPARSPARYATPPLGPVPPRRPASQGPRVSPHPASPPSHPHRLTTRAHMAARSLPRSNGTAGAAEISGRNPRRDHDGRAPQIPGASFKPPRTPPTSTLPRSTAPIPSRLATQLRRAEQRAAPPRPRPSAAPESRPRSVSTPPGPPGTSQSFYPRLRPLQHLCIISVTELRSGPPPDVAAFLPYTSSPLDLEPR